VISVSAPFGFRAAGNERQLANLVAAESKRNGIVSLDHQPRAAAEQR
jgi:hypothetical protein